MPKYRLTINVNTPKGVDKKDLGSYAASAVTFYSKGLDPESPLWYIEVTKVKVKRRKR